VIKACSAKRRAKGFPAEHRLGSPCKCVSEEFARVPICARTDRRIRQLRAADKLEKVVADDLWPLPKYEEMLFIK
jgi:hypothetical protein